LAPLEISLSELNPYDAADRDRKDRIDAILDVRWERRRYRFVVEIKLTSSPRAVKAAADQARQLADPPRDYPMIIVPYLSEEQLRGLEERGISGIDLAGNGVVLVPGELLVFRSGKKAEIRDSRPIRNPYRGTSSIVARVLLARPVFATVNGILAEIGSRNARVALSTISKSLSALEDDLIVSREAGSIRLLQPDKLLDELAANFRPPSPVADWRVKALSDVNEFFASLIRACRRRRIDCAVAGKSSVDRYASMAREPVYSVYCTRLAPLMNDLGVLADADSRFPNFELLETRDRGVYFDLREEDNVPWSSPVQTWLELMAGDKRQRDAADQIRDRILDEIARGIDAGAGDANRRT